MAAAAIDDAIVLRTANVDDAALVAELHATSRASAYRGMLPDDYLDHHVRDEAFAHWPARLEQLQAGAGEALIAERRHRPVGFICLQVPDENGSVYVDNLHAGPDQKGTGVGTVLLNAAEHWARDRGATAMHLFVLEANQPAAGFYESRGWRLAGREDHRMGGIAVVVRRYALPLTQRQLPA